MVLSIFDVEQVNTLFEVQPLRKLIDRTTTQGDTQYFDYVLFGNSLGVGTDFAKDPSLRPISALDVRGNVRCNQMIVTSDKNKKDDIELFDPARCLDIVRGADVYSFRYKGTEGQTLGFIAQQLREVCPMAVGETADGLTVNHTLVTALLAGAIKEIDRRLSHVEERVAVTPARTL